MTVEEILRDSIHLFSVSDQAKVRELVALAYEQGSGAVAAKRTPSDVPYADLPKRPETPYATRYDSRRPPPKDEPQRG